MVEALEKAIDLVNRYPPIIKLVAAVTLIFLATLILLMVIVPRQNPQSRTLFIKDINQLWQPLSTASRRRVSRGYAARARESSALAMIFANEVFVQRNG